MAVFIILMDIAAILALALLSPIRISHFLDENRALCEALDRAYAYSDYKKCLYALRCHHLKLIPFVTDRNVGRLYDRIYKKKQPDAYNRKQGFAAALAPSLIGMVVCTVCLCGISFAWFTGTASNAANKIQAAEFEVAITVDDTTVTGNTCTLNAGNHTHTINITVPDTSTASYGYVDIKYDNNTITTGTLVRHGVQLSAGSYAESYSNSISITDNNTIVTFEPHWGIKNSN